MKQLLICRHAKSSWKNPELADIARPLNRRGKRNAPFMGERLAARGMMPELILSSPAKRARKTAVRLCRGMTAPADMIRINDTLYDSDVPGLLELISTIDDCYGRVMLIGHNPEFTSLVNHLAQIEIYNVPTCGIVAFSLAVNSWQDVQQAQAELLFFDYPKKQHSDPL
ncbi:MAG: histidine phosphatase family protein [Deltaproteobacteria bacterium]|nr:histidine phosphatase family protein [Deltaproteobacteria bacterium]